QRPFLKLSSCHDGLHRAMMRRKLNYQVCVLPKQEISSIVPTLGSSWHDRTNVGIIAARWATMVYDGKAQNL
ncbi:hypothetical protein A2U01_0071403, partial [Trifolium medium]|nr:hypothetical protein [Trifolium medium]